MLKSKTEIEADLQNRYQAAKALSQEIKSLEAQLKNSEPETCVVKYTWSWVQTLTLKEFGLSTWKEVLDSEYMQLRGGETPRGLPNVPWNVISSKVEIITNITERTADEIV